MDDRLATILVHAPLALLAIGVHANGSGQPLENRPNIVLMMADDMGWGDPSYNGGWINTPNLDTMARNGLRFNRFYAACAVCSPTRASCLTGRNPFRLGVHTANAGHLGFDETPISEILANAGYTCGHFGKWHLGTLTTVTQDSNRGGPGSTAHYSAPWHHRYDTCFATEAKVPTFHPMRVASNGAAEPGDFSDATFYGTRYWAPPADTNAWATAPEGVPIAVTSDLSGDDSRVLMDRVIPFVRTAAAAGRPFLAVVWFHTPHQPLVDPEGLDGVNSAESYTDAVQDLDQQVGRLRAELDALGIRTNTMFWFCSDNGPENGVGQTGGLRARKRSLHEGGLRVPGILEWPAMIPAARTTDYPCVTSDYYPTILDALDLRITNQKPIDGISLMPVITNTSDTLTRTHAIGFRFDASRSWVTQQHKLISKDGGSTYELYDLLADTNETNNILSSEPVLASRLQLELETWLAAVAADERYVPPVAPASTTNVIINGSFEQAVVPYANSNGGTLLKLDAAHNVIVVASPTDITGTDTGLDTDEWVLTTLARGFAYSPTSGNPGGAMVQNSRNDGNGKGRGFLQFVADGSNTRGLQTMSADLMLQEQNVAHAPLTLQFELYGWTETVDGYAFTLGAPDAGLFNFEANGGSVSNLVLLLKDTVVATTNSAWRRVTLPVVDFGAGYDCLCLRIAVANQDADTGSGADIYAVDNVRFIETGMPQQTNALILSQSNTVDAQGDVPGDDDNNIDKFDAGGEFDAEFTTTLYVRGSSSVADRRVRAFCRWDLSVLPTSRVTRATLRFRGYSLNDTSGNDVDLQVARLQEEWTGAADRYRPSVADMVNGRSVITAGAPRAGREFAVDVTPIVTQWLNANATNHGFFLQLADPAANNGLGIKTHAVGGIRLEVCQLVAGDADDDGMSDDWEVCHFGSTTNSTGAIGDDWDSDGFGDQAEYLAGTDPTNALSRLVVTGIAAGNREVILTWQGVRGKTYSVIERTNMASAAWSTNAGGLTGVEPETVHTAEVANAHVFLKVIVE